MAPNTIPLHSNNSSEMDGLSDDDVSGENSTNHSDNESLDFADDDNDFLDAVNGTPTKKRKVEDEEKIDSDNDEEEVMDKTEMCAPPKKKRKKKKASAADMKPPTAEEMIRLRETENLFHSNLFRMQIEEMIKEVRTKKTERKQIKPWLDSLKDLLCNINDSNNYKLNLKSMKDNVLSPLPHFPTDSQNSSCFQKPELFSIIGSYSADCCLGPSLSVDVAVIIPKKCLLKEDYLNARYHYKRAAYLGRLAKTLQKSELIDKEKGVCWTTSGYALSPRLVVHPAGKLSAVKVYISAVPHQKCFKLSRFTPDKNNIRESWMSEGAVEDCSTPTPLYNTSVMRDLVMPANEAIRQQTLENNNNLKDAIALLRVWLRQRKLDLGQGSFNGYLISMLVVALSMSRRLNPLMSSYQIIRNVWLELSQSDWTKEGFTMCTIKQEKTAPSLQEFHRHFDVVFVDITGYCNLAADIHRVTYLKVKQEAQLAVQCLDNPDMNSFQALFMTPMPFLRQYDHIVCIKGPNKKNARTIFSKESNQAERTNHFFSEDVLFAKTVLRLLQKGVGGRVEQLAYQLTAQPEWPVGKRVDESDHNLVIGLRLNPETAYSVVEKGPPANEPEAAEFRSLWGSQCELRRFRDGTVCEAVVWAEPEASLAARRMVTRSMVRHLLHDRLGVSTTTYCANQLEPLVTEKAFKPDGFEYGSGEEAGNVATQVFEKLASQLRELKDLPLDVVAVQGVSPVFRGAEVFPPLASLGTPPSKAGVQGDTCWLLSDSLSKAPELIAPIEGVLQLGLSRKWPEDPEAVKRIRAAFNLHIAKALLEQFDLQTQAFPEYIDIFKDGFVFRIHLTYEREVVLLKESKTPDGKICYRDTPESLELEKCTIHLPQLTGALHGVQQQFVAFSVTCRLAKRWLSAQLLDAAHMPEVAVELLVSSLFLSPEPYRVLTQPQPMFLRFLHLLSHHNWNLEPVIVNFNGDLKREDLVEIESHFRTERATLPPMFIATQYDKSKSVWTKEAPLLPVLVRVASLAKESLTILENNFLTSSLVEQCKVVFRPPLELYDALIRLKPLMLPRLIHAVDFSLKTEPFELKKPDKRRKIPITGFDPAQCYLQELRASYSDIALFFHDTYGGTVIGVLFKPSAFERHEFKVSHVNCRKPDRAEMKKTILGLNLDAIIEDFYILGTGLVKTIDLSEKITQKI